MNVSYTAPFQQSWSRMVRILFRPFRIDFWLGLGFAAFLSEYLSHSSGGGGGGGKFHMHGRPGGEVPEVVRHAAGFLLDPVWGVVAICIGLLALVVALVFGWISSRGKFIYLDDVLRERSVIVEPWRRFRRQGNSLFVFTVILIAVTLALFIMVSLPLIPPFLIAISHGTWWPALGVLAVTWWVAAMLPLGIAAGCVYAFLHNFVVPIMYRYDLGVLAAWGRFFQLFRNHVLDFVGFAFFYLLLMIATAVAIGVFGFTTCCIGFLLLAIPYVGSVILLPVDTTMRGLGPDFLAQFGPEWDVRPSVAPAPATPAPPAPSAPAS